MADEYSQPPHNKILGIPEAYNWNSRTSKSGSELEAHLENLPEPDEFAAEIIENLEAGLNSFRDVLAALGTSSVG